MSIPRFAAAILAVLSTTSTLALDAPLPRHPAPSPDATVIAFSWQGDIWTVSATGGTARRLTAHPAAERHPVWSRDGRWLAFASDRHGNPDVLVMPTDGSLPPRRLTHASEPDLPLDFSPDGEQVLFASSRAEGVRWMSGFHTVPITGGTPSLAEPALGRWAAFSPDGSALAFVRGSTKWTRSRYRGPANRELWLRTAADEYVQLTDFDGDDDCPSWIDGHTLAFLSARSGTKNVFLLDLVTGSPQQLTFHDGSDARFPRCAADGSLVAYEHEDAIWTVPASGGDPTRLRIDVPPDAIVNPVERRVTRDSAEDLEVSPDGSLAAFVIHGDVFLTAIASKEDQEVAKPPTVQITKTPEREAEPHWSPDGKSLLFTSARDGNNDLFFARPAQPETAWTQPFELVIENLTTGQAEEHTAAFSPDGTRIAFVRNKGNLVVRSLADGGERTLLEHWSPPDFAWSPDGEWIAYSVPNESYNSEVWIVAATGGTPYNVSRHPDDDQDPRWSPDGKRLVWLSKRHADTGDVWGVWLTRDDHERTAEGWLQLWKKEKKTGAGAAGSEEPGDTDQPPPLPHVTVELDGLWERVEAITELKGDEEQALVSPDGRTVVFTAEHEGERDLYSVRWDGDELERLTDGGLEPESVQLTGDGMTIFYVDKDGVVARVGLDGKKGDPVPFTARHEVNRRAERAAIFEEAWRALNEWFYDPAFHGVDWAAKRDLYRPWALAASHDADFEDVMNLMLGELNASHMGYRPKAATGGESTGWLGVTFDAGADGPGILVREVLRDSPAARKDVAIRPGDRIIAVDGHQIGAGTNVYSLFADTVDLKVVLAIRSGTGEQRRAVARPTDFDHMEELRLREWVRQRRSIVDRTSQGRLGYLYIELMNTSSFEEFERDLFAAGDGKEGLIIDVRSNGGGWTTDYLMAVLMVRRHAYTVPRDGDPELRAYPQGRLPLAAWTRPALTLCNEDSYSNAEIFSHAFKSLDRGPVVGSPTFGAVISTGATWMLNGARVRLPMRGWYVAESGMNMEHNGARPDVVVWQPPEEDTAADRDTQLERAVEVLMDRIDDDPRAGAW